jgi:hypothetical protein
MTNTETRIKTASRELAKALIKIGKTDEAMRRRLENLLCNEMQAVREGK